MYQFLYKYLDMFQKGNYGKRIVSKGHKGTKEDPIPIPYVKYEQCVIDFMKEVLDFPNMHESYEDEEDEDENESNKNSENYELFNQILTYVTMEKFRDGMVLEKLDDGTIIRLISTLKTRYESVEKAILFLLTFPYGTTTNNYECFLNGAGVDLNDFSEKEANILNEMFEEERKNTHILIKYTNTEDEQAPWLYTYYRDQRL